MNQGSLKTLPKCKSAFVSTTNTGDAPTAVLEYLRDQSYLLAFMRHNWHCSDKMLFLGVVLGKSSE
jgi:hypothetical protein